MPESDIKSLFWPKNRFIILYSNNAKYKSVNMVSPVQPDVI